MSSVATKGLAVLCLAIACRVAYAEQWAKVETSHFVVLTTDPRQAPRVLQRLELARSFFESSAFRGEQPEDRVTVVVFRNADEYTEYQVSPGASAFSYSLSEEEQFVVLSDMRQPQQDRILLHEYAHCAVDRAFGHLPLWLREGLAEFYSSLTFEGNSVLVGGVPREYASPHPGMDLARLFALDYDSLPGVSIEDRRAMYFQSWALVHMLIQGERYGSGFPGFMKRLESGNPVEEAFRAAYGESLAELETDLAAYIPGGLARPKLVTVDVAPRGGVRFSTPSNFEVELTLARLLTANPANMETAKVRLQRLSATYNDQPEPEEELFRLCSRLGLTAESEVHILAAASRGTVDPEFVYMAARLEEANGAPAGDVASLLRRAIALRPDYYEARLTLGCLMAQTGNLEVAKKEALLAQDFVRNPEQNQRLAELLDFIVHRQNAKN